MKEKCFNHPNKEAISFCHSCEKYFCADCLSIGRAYYYCKDEKCQLLLNEENERFQETDDKINFVEDQRWKEDSKRFYKKTFKILSILWVLLTLFLFMVTSYKEKIYYLPIISFIVCAKWLIIIYLLRITIYKHFFWKRKLSEELSKEHAQ